MKPKKPYDTFPLTPHNNGRFAKKIAGVMYYFGHWKVRGKNLPYEKAWKAALAEYEAAEPAIRAGETPSDEVLLRELCDAFIAHKTGRVKPLTLAAYTSTCYAICDFFGRDTKCSALKSDDWERLCRAWEAKWAVSTVRVEIAKTRVLFTYGYESEWLDKPMRFGVGFKGKRVRASTSPKTFTAAEIRMMLAAAKPREKAITLLGINCAFGAADCAAITPECITGEYITLPRPKTGEPRRCHLWKETLAALAAAPKLAVRRANGQALCNVNALIARVGLKGHTTYHLRHTFRTVASGTKDFEGVTFCMGHSLKGIAAVYQHAPDDERLKAISLFVRKWLYAKG
jgi:integrase